MDKIIAWLRQPSTLTAVGVAIAAAVYWFTKSAELAAVALAAVLGTVSDSTSALLTKVESIENIVANIVVPSKATSSATSTPVVDKGTANHTDSIIKQV